jgi:hypothetical protein
VAFVQVGALSAADLSHEMLPAEAPGSALPAVSAVNGKIDVLGGGYSDGGIAGVGASVSIPLGFRYGTQIDGLVASLDEEAFLSISNHLFWRDPAMGLLGVYGSYGHYDGFGGVTTWRAAFEGESYRGPITLRALAGVEGGDADAVTTATTFFDYDIDTRFFDKVDVVYYPNPDLQLFVGHRYTGGQHALGAGAEYLWRSDGRMATSTFIEGRLGEEDGHAVWAGLRFYFGPEEKSLIRRHREDDPYLWEPETHLGVIQPLLQDPGIPNNPL